MKLAEFEKKYETLVRSCEATNVLKSIIMEVIVEHRVRAARNQNATRAKELISIKKAKQREAQLIQAAYKDGYCDGFKDAGVVDFDDESYFDASVIYGRIGIEELK